MLLTPWQTWRMLHTARRSSRRDPAVLRRGQGVQLRRLLQHAYANVAVYRRLYDEAGFHPSEFRSLDDLDRIPRLSKQRLAETTPEERVARGVDLSGCQTVNTSGSTGLPLRIYLGPRDACWQRAVAWRILFEHGFRWTDRTLEIRLAPLTKSRIQKLGIAPKDCLTIWDPPESWARLLARRRHEVLAAHSSTLESLAEAVQAAGLEIRPPRIIISDSEMLTPNSRRAIRRTLGTDPVDVFGMYEVSNFAWECERREGFHISADSHIVEVEAPIGKAGPMLVTGLGMWTMPIIRYETGDIAEMGSHPCPCGRTLPLLVRVQGRASDAVVLADGQKLYWNRFYRVLSACEELRQWQVVQEDLNRARIRVVIQRDAPGLRERLLSDLKKALPTNLALDLEPVDGIEIMPGRKYSPVVSRIAQRSGSG